MDKSVIQRLYRLGFIKDIATACEAMEDEKYSIHTLGIPEDLLMENAGANVARLVADGARDHRLNPEILIFAGPGNNGGDAVVAARHLVLNKFKVHLFILGQKENYSKSLATQIALMERINADGHPNNTVQLIDQAETLLSSLSNRHNSASILIDGIFGAGLNRKPQGLFLEAINLINEIKKIRNDNYVVSIDVPSGLSLEATPPLGACVFADQTITFSKLKRAHISEPTRSYCGHSVALSIGLFKRTHVKNHWIHRRDVLKDLFKEYPNDCHKSDFGHVLVFEGHPHYRGASRLSALGALRVGAGLITLATGGDDEKSSDLPEFMHCPLGEISDGLLKKVTALVIGPGLSADESYHNLALKFLNGLKKNVPFLVFDADALPLLLDPGLKLSNKTIVATPHMGEAAKLLGWDTDRVKNNRFLALEALASLTSGSDNDVIWLLKGGSTLVRGISSDIFIFYGDLPILSAGGSGDVLSGAIAGLYKQTESPLACVLLAISIQLSAAAELSKRMFKGNTASELANVFPKLTNR